MRIEQITRPSVASQVAQLRESIGGKINDRNLETLVEAAQQQEFDDGIEADTYIAKLMRGEF